MYQHACRHADTDIFSNTHSHRPHTFPNGRFVFQSSTCLCLMAFFLLSLLRDRAASVVSFDVFGRWEVAVLVGVFLY